MGQHFLPETRAFFNGTAKVLALVICAWALLYPFVFPPPSQQVVDVEQYNEDIAPQPVPDFASIKNIRQKKRAFFAYLRPVIESQNERILTQRHVLLAIKDKVSRQQTLTLEQQHFIGQLSKKYKIKPRFSLQKKLDILTHRVDLVPIELVLVQGANESAWGTSRFARLGYNFFGLWCYRPGCGFVPSRRVEGGKHEVARFDNIQQGVAAYLLNLNTHNAYKGLRQIRTTLRQRQQPINASRIAEGLMSYSERGQAYIDELQAMIRVNEKYM